MPAAGDLIEDKYRLVRQIGEGGMATVWEAEHERLQTRVAVKFLAGLHFGKEADRARFLDEARAAAAIRHRNVIDIVDFGTTDDETPFMVMELLSGQTLADRIDADAPMAVPAVAELAVQILGALTAVHDAGIVHRDLKPENVMFALDVDGAVPKLVDFGISKILEREGEDPKRPKTREGLVLGTPQYMSPEQAAGSTSVDARSDIYAVGVILYEMLTGDRPYDHESVVKLLSAVLEGTAKRVDIARPDLPAVIADVVTKAMATEPGDRFADAREMRAALVEAMKAPQDPRPPDAVTVPPPSRARREEENTKPRRVELPDPTPLSIPPPPQKKSSRGAIYAVVGVIAALAIGGVIWLVWPSADPIEEEGAIAAPQIDAGIVSMPGFITVRLIDVPDAAFVVLDGEIIDPERIRDLRDENGVIALPIPRRRGPFDLRVRVSGHREWRVRRWTRQDFEFTVRPREN